VGWAVCDGHGPALMYRAQIRHRTVVAVAAVEFLAANT
jgi:hypothetical protein